MTFLPKGFFPACLFLLMISHDVLAQATLPPGRGPGISITDSIARIRVLHHRYDGNAMPRTRATNGTAGPISRNPSATRFPSAAAAGQAGITFCYDSSGRYFLQKDSMTYYVEASILSVDGSVLISGEWASRNAPNPGGGFLMKCSDTGTVQWARLYDSLHHSLPSYFNFYSLLELRDGSILMAGVTNDQVTGNNDLLLTHVDNTGHIIWSKAYKSRLWSGGNGSADYFAVKQMVQDPYGSDVFLTSPHWANGSNITRVRIADGTLAWSRYYQMYSSYTYFDIPFGLVAEPNELLFFGRASRTYGDPITTLYRISKTTGDTISTRFYTTAYNTNYNLGVVMTEQVVKLRNGHYALPGKLYKYFYGPGDTARYLYHASVQEFDAGGGFVKAYCFRNNIESNLYNSRLRVNSDGTGLFSMFHFQSGFLGDAYYIQFADGQILHQRKRHYVQGIPLENPAVRTRDGGDLIVKLLGDTIDNINKIEFLKLHLSDTSSACLGLKDSSTFTEPYALVPVRWGIDSIPSNDLYETRNRTIVIRDDNPNSLPACRQLSHCDTLSFLPSSDTVCIASPLLVRVRKTPGCEAGIFFEYDTTVLRSFGRINDSVYALSFKAAGSTVLRGSIKGCRLLTDSVRIRVLDSKGPVHLGPDTVLCPGNRIVLHAGAGYSSYQWQDGSADSLYTVLQPGKYRVRVTDGCGNGYTDSVLVSAHPPVLINIGPDRGKCNADTLHLNAPPGFLNYTWSPQYNINVSTGPSVVVNPLTDTTYYIKAEKTPGCFAYDSVHVTVHHSAAIRLGKDTSFCYGDSLLLNAGPGFNSYRWADGSTSSRLAVYKAGSWWVTAIDNNGCLSGDTLRVMNVWPLPVGNMNHDNFLCRGSLRTLQPGNFLTYRWQDGSSAPSYTAADTGRYRVIFTDIHQCRGSDSVMISKIRPVPAGFLPPDTVICARGKLELVPLRQFNSYLWSTGATSATLPVLNAGTFWLQVADAYHCVGKDTVTVGSKDCLVGLHMPGAFTPNHDGRNDVFRPLVGGMLAEYELTIYNRYGQLLFRSRNASEGWDGSFRGQPQDPGGYPWICVYRFEGQARQTEKGLALLVR